ncbi:DNA polymerase family B-domain-containing protein [Auriculariales sp. MPI-PUGE-AT-0066]|nr:DNA polymerase family B-domain-containing protein [Auriculariales sp. MPI-PUGE-AT-0066]
MPSTKDAKPLSRPLEDHSNEPATKKRKVQPRQSTSFADTLARIQSETSSTSATEGGASEWARPALDPIDPRTQSLVFQQIDVEEVMDGFKSAVRMFGVTEAGHSVMALITDFLPYFYVPIPRQCSTWAEDGTLSSFHSYLNTQWANSVIKIEVVLKKSLYGYGGDNDSPFWKITLAMQKALRMFERGEIIFSGFPVAQMQTYESNVGYDLRFMIETSIVGMSWVECPAGKYSIQTEHRLSHCQIELQIKYSDLIAHQPDGDWSKLAPLRILSFDIECAGRKGIFPEAKVDPVIQIANMVTRQGEDKPFVRNVFTLNTCSHIVGSDVQWAEFVRTVDPDVIIGYNIANFDLPYLLDRADALKSTNFHQLGRIIATKAKVGTSRFSSKAYGTRESKEVIFDGRLQVDILQFMQREYKLRSYTLNAVSAQFLGEQKEEVHHSAITELQNGTPDSRRRLAIYCLKDAYLPQRLMDKLMCFINYTEMARVTGIPFKDLLTRGQQIKVVSQLMRKQRKTASSCPQSNPKYEGATVIEPEKGYYDVPIATLDFASLYPSIMMAHNLCYTTLVSKQYIDAHKLVKDKDYIQTPQNHFFMTADRRKGLLPTVLENLIAARKRAKADLKKETDPFKRAVLDGRQLALKISANSVYGFTGATIGRLPCLEISSSTTAYGRQMIEQTKQEVERRYNTANGASHDAQVIYGDTDSVMIRFGPTDLAEVMRLGAEAAEAVSSQFTRPIKLEFEKVYYPYLLISKKRYAGLYWTRTEKYDKLDSKGIESVRRDNCRLVATVIDTCLKKLLIDKNPNGAVAYTKQVISDLLQNKVDMSQLVITKALSKEEYAGKQAHVELAARMKTRDAGSAPAMGDRVAYVIIKGPKNAAAYEKSEDPLWVLDHNLPLDTRYYLDNQLSGPLMRIFEPILGEKAKSLLSGDHTRVLSIATPSLGGGGLMKFAVKTVTCLGCKTPLKANNTKNLYQKQVRRNLPVPLTSLSLLQCASTSSLQVAFARLWTQCQRCQGSLHQDVLCSNKDCPIFYRRKKAQKDVEEAVNVLDRFDGDW